MNCKECGTPTNPENGLCPTRACMTRHIKTLFASETRYVYDPKTDRFVVYEE